MDSELCRIPLGSVNNELSKLKDSFVYIVIPYQDTEPFFVTYGTSYWDFLDDLANLVQEKCRETLKKLSDNSPLIFTKLSGQREGNATPTFLLTPVDEDSSEIWSFMKLATKARLAHSDSLLAKIHAKDLEITDLIVSYRENYPNRLLLSLLVQVTLPAYAIIDSEKLLTTKQLEVPVLSKEYTVTFELRELTGVEKFSLVGEIIL